MGLRVKLWTPETRLHFVNYSNAEIHLNCYAKSNEKKSGKLIILPPNSRIEKKLKEILPSHIKDPSILPEDELLFKISNKSNVEAKFNVFEKGPFKFPPELMVLDTPQKMVEAYIHIININDFYYMEELTVDDVPENYKESPSFYSAINFYFGQMATALLRMERAEHYFEEAWKYCVEEDRWMTSYHWAKSLLYVIIYKDATTEYEGEIIHKSISVIERMLEYVKGNQIERLHKISVACMKAFIYCYLDEYDIVPDLFDNLDCSMIAEEDYKIEGFQNFLTYIVYGFCAAIELKDAKLMKKLCKLFEKEKDEFDIEQNPMKYLQRASLNIRAKGFDEYEDATMNIEEICSHLNSEFPNLKEFFRLNDEKDEKGVFNFIPFVE